MSAVVASSRICRLIGVVSALTAAVILGGCTAEDKPGWSFADESPYWCELIPKNAVVEVQQLDDDEPLGAQEFTAGGMLSRDDYACSVAIHEQTRNVIAVKVYRDEVIREEMFGMYVRTHTDPATVPPSRGPGKASGDDGWVLWRCGEHDVLMYVSLHDTSHATRDLEPQVILLLEIAQQRYAELANCDIRPPATPSPSPIAKSPYPSKPGG